MQPLSVGFKPPVLALESHLKHAPATAEAKVWHAWCCGTLSFEVEAPRLKLAQGVQQRCTAVAAWQSRVTAVIAEAAAAFKRTQSLLTATTNSCSGVPGKQSTTVVRGLSAGTDTTVIQECT
jgi:hypothetical protein